MPLGAVQNGTASHHEIEWAMIRTLEGICRGALQVLARAGLAKGSFSPPSSVFKGLQSDAEPPSRAQGLSFGS